ncbi:carbohydrate esterase family 4 protein [Apodospora peruviana]|uniref:Carbohydrate esterase family 4 protein n=1 Tax=Apodospora peruviana TaxID=516989 RepID=A0AAE0HVJ6_9PEZI|nr:carbohydrate esterase family 4 protein [Apodospora peruviana]
MPEVPASPEQVHATELADRISGLVPYGSIIEHCTIRGVVALTFDDGPYKYTNDVLDLLDEHNATATFFVNGHNWVDEIDDQSTPWPATLRRMVRSGHQVGSHGWSHVDMMNTDSQSRNHQIRRLESALLSILGEYPTYFRPPYASCEPECLAELEGMGYHVVNFDLDTKDYEHNQPDTVRTAQNIFADALDSGTPRSSFLVLSHDVHKTTAKSLVPFMLQKIRHRRYKAVTVGECLGDAPENWYRVS